RFVLQDRLEDPEPRPRGDHPLAPHGPHDRDVHPHVRPADGRDGGGVVVASRHVVEEIAHGGDPDPGELIRAPRPHALQELHRAPETRVAFHETQARIPRMNSSTSKVWRSSSCSPVPTSFTGIPYSCWSATTIPPRAEESIFASRIPDTST